MSEFKVTFGEFVAEEEINPFTDIVNQMHAANNAAGNDKCYVEIECEKGDGLKNRTYISKAANAINRTARIRKNCVPIKDAAGNLTGNVVIGFTLTKKHKARKGSEYVASTQTTDMAEKKPEKVPTPNAVKRATKAGK